MTDKQERSKGSLLVIGSALRAANLFLNLCCRVVHDAVLNNVIGWTGYTGCGCWSGSVLWFL